MGICRLAIGAPFHVLGQECFNAFGTSFALGQKTHIEGAWVAPLYTAAFLWAMAFWLLAVRPPYKSTSMRTVLAFYAFATGAVEVVRVIFDANRFAFVWAALHNLGEWGIIIHLTFSQQQVPKAWPWAMLWILFIIQNILFQPKFMVAAFAEQITGIWCDWLTLTLWISRLRDSWRNPEMKTLCTLGAIAAALHMLQILPLVALLSGYLAVPSVPLGALIAFTFPIVFYLYIKVADRWDRLTAVAANEETDVETNGEAHQGDDASDRLLRGKAATASPYLPQTLPWRKFLLIWGLTALLGAATIIVPRVAAPLCPSNNPGPAPGPILGKQLCPAPLTIAGTTRLVAKPGREGELGDMLASMPAETRLEEGNLSFDLALESPRTYHIADSWTSLRTLYKRLATSPVDYRTFYTPEFKALVEAQSLGGPFHPLISCGQAAQQARLQSISFNMTLDAPASCVWAQLDDFANAGYVGGALAFRSLGPNLRSVTFPRPGGANCTILEHRQFYPPVANHTLRYHTISGCWTDATAGGNVEVNVDNLSVVALGASRRRSLLTWTLEVAAMAPNQSEAVYKVFSTAGRARLPAIQQYFETACSRST